ncbi:3'-5' exonuclease [Methylobacterium gnaphalii]|uniref:3'-5' exonuclease n=1 Tax=Methylobacterium gnaphalii TaxID=1010610 RepID=A0A512JR94_9HYPH|nr:3'-5' exonuclease [Methylobacterium gnaphalii]GEP12459.1 3'-5' exonuclease [Methylobacterium gnaphalii]GJD71529.1 hypothetical protein MMMDOFMJ_4490 [Methylobacterium gnaphalii]GLS49787.1 3'-5' exonuclease [Methylobacterium gnaphalii]
MKRNVVVVDLETVPDLAAVARVHDLDPSDPDAAWAKLGKGFPKLIYHQIVVIGSLVAEYDEDAWRVQALDAPHSGDVGEAELIAAFSARLERLRPQLVSYAGHGFDLPVLRYRSLVNGLSTPGLSVRPYHRRYDEAALDLCDQLGNFEARSKVTLDTMCRALGLPGKTAGLHGGCVADLVGAGRLDDVAAYCMDDVVATFRLFLAYERCRGHLDLAGHARSEANLAGFLATRMRDAGAAEGS